MRNTNKPPYAATDIDYSPKNPPTVKQVMVLIFRSWGWTEEKIAEELGVSRRTVRGHIKALKKRGLYPTDPPL